MKKFLFLIILIATLITGCSHIPNFVEIYPQEKMEKISYKSRAVHPTLHIFKNVDYAINTLDFLRKEINNEIMEKGYYCIDIGFDGHPEYTIGNTTFVNYFNYKFLYYIVPNDKKYYYIEMLKTENIIPTRNVRNKVSKGKKYVQMKEPVDPNFYNVISMNFLNEILLEMRKNEIVKVYKFSSGGNSHRSHSHGRGRGGPPHGPRGGRHGHPGHHGKGGRGPGRR